MNISKGVIILYDTFCLGDFSLLSKELTFIYHYRACVVPCGGPKKSPRTSPIVQIVFYFWPFEISGNILRIKKLV